MIAVICATVLILPMNATATLFVCPIWAIHSRSAEMAISRPMMMKAITGCTRSRCTSTIRAPVTMSLSATGSRKAPKAEVWLSLRASQPSSQSVTAAAVKTMVATRF